MRITAPDPRQGGRYCPPNNSLTQLARNAWICWMTNVKQPTTRQKHIARAVEQLAAGKRRPCCWMGCIHRTDKEISPSVRAILQRRGEL